MRIIPQLLVAVEKWQLIYRTKEDSEYPYTMVRKCTEKCVLYEMFYSRKEKKLFTTLNPRLVFCSLFNSIKPFLPHVVLLISAT